MIGRGGLPGVDPSRRMFEELPELEVFIVCTSPVSRGGPAVADFAAEAVMAATLSTAAILALAAAVVPISNALITGCGACKDLLAGAGPIAIGAALLSIQI